MIDIVRESACVPVRAVSLLFEVEARFVLLLVVAFQPFVADSAPSPAAVTLRRKTASPMVGSIVVAADIKFIKLALRTLNLNVCSRSRLRFFFFRSRLLARPGLQALPAMFRDYTAALCFQDLDVVRKPALQLCPNTFPVLESMAWPIFFLFLAWPESPSLLPHARLVAVTVVATIVISRNPAVGDSHPIRITPV